MKLKVIDMNNTEKDSKELPAQFMAPVRHDLIQRAVLAIEAGERQPYGTTDRAGKRHSVWVSKRRRDYRVSYGHGISRVPRKVHSSNGTQFNWVGAEAPGTVGGRVAHPPKADRIWEQKINETENRKAIRSAIAATVVTDIVKARGHRIPKEFPFIIDNKAETLAKTKDVVAMLEKLGFTEELERTSKRGFNAGKGKIRGRRYSTKVGPLFVVSKECSLAKAARNVPGATVVIVNSLNAKVLAPGAHPGRLTLWTESAIDTLANEKLFTDEYKGMTIKKEKPAKKEEKPAKAAPAKKKAAKPKAAKKSE